MIDLKQALSIHQILIEKFGGSEGVRDQGALEAALNRPYATFDQKDLYPSPIDKAEAILESILINHPFIDGNKRTAYVLMRLTLMQYEMDIDANQKEKYDFIINIVEGKIKFDQIKEWLEKNMAK
ncbi:MAG: type II toxin-antitoxin system death-on-curing family toxin [Xenococcus sp. (in: cyanobacteria)]